MKATVEGVWSTRRSASLIWTTPPIWGQSGATHGGMWLTPPGRKHEQSAEEEKDDEEEHTARRTAEEKRELMYEHEDTSPSNVQRSGLEKFGASAK